MNKFIFISNSVSPEFLLPLLIPFFLFALQRYCLSLTAPQIFEDFFKNHAIY